MFQFNMRLVTLFLLFFSVNTRSVQEPLCSKFSYDEQLLEKMVRVEFNVNNMEKNMLETEKSMKKTETVMQETDASMRELEKTMRETEQRMSEKEANLTASERRMKDTEETMVTTHAEILATQKNMLNSLKEFDEKRKVLQQLEDKLEIMMGKTVVAFHAHKVADKSVANKQVFVFTEVLLNEGSGYSSSNGYFTAPVSGIYYFNSHICVKDSKMLSYTLQVNSKNHAGGHYKANSEGTCTSFSVTALMRSGERVWVTIDNHGSSSTDLLYEDADDWNYFSGFLIRQTIK